MSGIDPQVHVDLDPDHLPLFGEKAPPSRHLVKEHQRILPPRAPIPPDPDALEIPGFDWPEPPPPQPRVVKVRPRVRRNPRRKETTMTEYETDAATCLPPENRTDVTAMKDAQAVTQRPDLGGLAHARNSDPATSHGAAQVATHSLRRRMAEVLRVFQAQAFTARGLGDQAEGYTDDELVDRLARLDVKGSPSGFRTARKDLDRLGLVEPLGATEDGMEYVTRPTRLGNDAVVYVLTEAGRDYPLPDA